MRWGRWQSCMPFSFFPSSVGAPAASDSKHHKNAKDYTDDITQVNFIHLAYIISNLRSKDAKFSILWSISLDYVNLAGRNRYKIQ